MAGKHIWKLLLTVMIVAFSVSYLIPLEDKDFSEYLRGASDSEEFYELLDRAETRMAEEDSVQSVYVGLRDIVTEERIDLSQYFPDINLDPSLYNLDKKNKILLGELKKRSEAKLKRGLDIAGGISVTLQVDPAELENVELGERREKLSKAIQIIEDRINTYGVSEPVVRAVGEDRIEVQIPDMNTKDNPDLLDSIKKPARLDFREVHMTAVPGRDPKPIGYTAMTTTRDTAQGEFEETLYVKNIPALTGKYVTRAVPVQNELGGFSVSLTFDDEGKDRFGAITTKLAGRGRLAIVLDGKLTSAPTVQSAITDGRGELTGNYTQLEAFEQANILNNPLEFSLQIAELYEVGPSLAADSINSAVFAAKVGVTCIAIFMLIYYMVGGIVALISVALNVSIVLGILASFDAALTLPGIAGIILTVGMAVDANILIFERIREELREGKTLKAALVGGFQKVFSTIFDANVTTLLVSVVMLSYGTGPVKGFGLTLAIGVVTTVFCALIVSKMLLELLIENEVLKKFTMLSIVRNPSANFLKYRVPAFAMSWSIVMIGIFGIYLKKDSILGIDFLGGDEIILQYNERIETSDIIVLAEEQQLGEVSAQYITPLGSDLEVLKVQTPFEQGSIVVQALQTAFPSAGLEVEGENKIGPSVGDEITFNAMMSIGISLALILLYIAFRFEIGYGVGAIIATIHDILLTVGVFVLVPGHQFTAPMIAAILLIVGYSLNDTIVVFDRIREELQLRPTTKLREVINIAINAVISRSLLTSITTLLAAGSLLIFGTGVINDIAFTFTIGILTGTFSSIFIASPVFFWWHKGDRRSVETSHDVAPEYEWQAGSKASE